MSIDLSIVASIVRNAGSVNQDETNCIGSLAVDVHSDILRFASFRTVELPVFSLVYFPDNPPDDERGADGFIASLTKS